MQANEQNFPSTKDMYGTKFFEAYNFVTTSITDRFDKSDFVVYGTMQNVLLKALHGEGRSKQPDT